MSYIATFGHYKYTQAKLTGKIKKLQKVEQQCIHSKFPSSNIPF